MSAALDSSNALASIRAESGPSDPDSNIDVAEDSGSRSRKSQKVCSGQVASQRHVATEQKRRDKINEGYTELQALLPCSEKVEKARLLMQAAEYTKQLQAAMQQLLDSDATSSLPEELQYSIRKLLPPARQGKDDGATSGMQLTMSATPSHDPLALLAEHAQHAQATESAAEKAGTGSAGSGDAAPASLAVSLPDLAALASNPLFTAMSPALLQQLQLQMLAMGQQGGMLPNLAAGLPTLLALPGAQSLLASLTAQLPAVSAAPAVAPAAGGGGADNAGEGEKAAAAAPAKRKAGNKVRQHSSAARLAKEESPSSGEDADGRPAPQS